MCLLYVASQLNIQHLLPNISIICTCANHLNLTTVTFCSNSRPVLIVLTVRHLWSLPETLTSSVLPPPARPPVFLLVPLSPNHTRQQVSLRSCELSLSLSPALSSSPLLCAANCKNSTLDGWSQVFKLIYLLLSLSPSHQTLAFCRASTNSLEHTSTSPRSLPPLP